MADEITTLATLISSLHVSNDNGLTFSDPFNISNNTGISANPQISSEGNNVYVVWEMQLLATVISSLQGVPMVVRHLVNQKQHK